MDNPQSIHVLIETEREYKQKLNEILKKYFLKFIEKLLLGYKNFCKKN